MQRDAGDGTGATHSGVSDVCRLSVERRRPCRAEAAAAQVPTGDKSMQGAHLLGAAARRLRVNNRKAGLKEELLKVWVQGHFYSSAHVATMALSPPHRWDP